MVSASTRLLHVVFVLSCKKHFLLLNTKMRSSPAYSRKKEGEDDEYLVGDGFQISDVWGPARGEQEAPKTEVRAA